MFPEKMRLLEIIFQSEDIRPLYAALYAFGSVEIEGETLLPEDTGLDKIIDNELENRIADELSAANDFLSFMKPYAEETPHDITRQEDLSEKEMFSLFDTAKDCIEKYTAALAGIDAQKKIAAYKTWLFDNGISLNDLRVKNILVYTGYRPSNISLRLLENEMKEFHCLYSEHEGYIFLAAAADAESYKTIESVSAKYSFISLGLSAANLAYAENEKDLMLEKIKKLAQQSEAVKRRMRYLEKEMHRVNEMKKIRRMQRCMLVRCWVPESCYENLGSVLKESGIVMKCRSADADELARNNAMPYEKIPSLLKKPSIGSFFRPIVSLYGHPAYGHFDPTLISGITFMIMFGIMFADAGHGLVLFVAGLLLALFRNVDLLRKAAPLFLCAGVFSSLFGVLFGEFFGIKNLFEPVWFSPAENLGLFLRFGTIIGGVMVSCGVIVNSMQMFFQRNIFKAVFGQWGLFSLCFYWVCWYFIWSMMYSLEIGNIYIAAAVCILPLTFIMAGNIIQDVRTRSGETAEKIFMPVELVISFLSNTVSFVRVAAFGLTHISLMGVVYLVAAMSDSGVSGASIAIEGNILVLILEGLIVSIQGLRLQYYEFYSRFFFLEGRRFVPLKSER